MVGRSQNDLEQTLELGKVKSTHRREQSSGKMWMWYNSAKVL